jgi:hypothetical protein
MIWGGVGVLGERAGGSWEGVGAPVFGEIPALR